MNPLALPFVVLALFIAYRMGREDERHKLEMEAEGKPYALHFRGIRRKRLPEEPWATEESRTDALRGAGLM